jgi:hypothetical protein
VTERVSISVEYGQARLMISEYSFGLYIILYYLWSTELNMVCTSFLSVHMRLWSDNMDSFSLRREH